MSLKVMDVDPNVVGRAWETFSNGSPMQSILHNEFMGKIEALRGSLETAKPEELSEIQTGIKTIKILIGVLHRNDKLLTK